MNGGTDFEKLGMGTVIPMLHAILGKNFSFSIVGYHDEKPDLLWVSDKSNTMARFVSQAVRSQVDPAGLSDALRKLCPESATILLSRLDLDADDSEIYLVGLGDEKHASFPNAKNARDFFSRAGACLAAQINLDAENDQMAIELARHYEELNLIYQAEEHSKRTVDTAETLRQVVEDVSEYMDVDGAFLIIPGMEKWIFQTGRGPGILEKEKQIKGNVISALRALKQDAKSIVLNRDDDFTRASVEKDTSCLMILSPILDMDNQVIGALGCVRTPDRPEFETGDRKLIGAVGQRARKIVLMDLDKMTGLMTRTSYEHRVEELISVPARKDRHTLVCLINIDQFKLINDAYGVTAADDILKQLSLLLRGHVRDRDTIARLEGDTFALVLSQMRSVQDGWNAMERIRTDIASRHFPVQGNMVNITVRIGFTIMGPSIKTVSELNARVETALEGAKEKGGNCIQVYREGESKLEKKMDQARYAAQIEALMEKGRFVLYCQPIVPLTGGPMHQEILIRLMDNDQKILAPARFLGAAETYKKMPFIDKWVIENTCRILEKNAALLDQQTMSWGINLSGQSLQDDAFIKDFLVLLAKLPFPNSWLNFEITETVAIRNIEKVVEVIEQVRQMGFDIFLDDFGTGYSSFGYLQKLPVSYLKIDGVFIRDMEKNGFNQIAVQSIVNISKYLNIRTVAEFVENQQILDLLSQFGVDYAQGYHTGRPCDITEVLQKIATPEPGQAG